MTATGWPDHFHIVPRWAVPACVAAIFGLGAFGGWCADKVMRHRGGM